MGKIKKSVDNKIKCVYSELVELHKLVPHPRNSNNHPEKQVEMLAKIIDHLGQRHPVIISKRSGFMVAGHCRKLAIEKLGWGKCAVEYQDFKDEAEEFQFLISDNKIAELADHDDIKMLEGIKDLKLDEMKKAVNLLPQYKDYRAFCTAPDKNEHTICNVMEARL